MAAAAYLAIGGVAATIILYGAASSESSPPTILLTALVVVFGASIPIGERPWARTPRTLVLTLTVDLLLLVALLFLAPNPWMPAILFFVLIPVSSRLGPSLRYVFYATAPLTSFAAVLVHGHLSQEWSSVVSMVPGFFAIVVFAESFRAVRESSQESNKLLDELVSAQEQLREVAVVEERQRLAQEMHDAVGHRLTVASIHLEAVSKLIESDPARAAELASVSRDQVRAGLAELRSAVSSLSAPVLEARSLRRRITETVNAFRAGGGVEVATDLDPGADELDIEQATVLLRCVQEGLTNVKKHAPGARARVALTLLRREDRVELVIEDDGPAVRREGESTEQPESEEGGFGLRSLRGRAAAVGGTLEFSRLTPGSRLSVILPVSRR